MTCFHYKPNNTPRKLARSSNSLILDYLMNESEKATPPALSAERGEQEIRSLVLFFVVEVEVTTGGTTGILANAACFYR